MNDAGTPVLELRGVAKHFAPSASLSRLRRVTIPAVDGASAFEIIKGGAPIDLLFTDVVMPGSLDGSHDSIPPGDTDTPARSGR